MTALVVVLAAILIVGIALGIFARVAPRRPVPEAVPADPVPPWQSTTEWTKAAGEEFAGLPEAARCDLIFAVNDLRDERSQQLLVHALDDPSAAVALAAAHALAARGDRASVEAYVQRHPGERAQRILDTLTLLS